MPSITVQRGKVVMRDGKVGTEQGCCCDDEAEAGYCCVDGECVASTREDCERCEPILDQNGFPTGFDGLCGEWVKGPLPQDCDDNSWLCPNLPAFVCIQGLPPEWDAFKELTGGPLYFDQVNDPVSDLGLVPRCGRWRLQGTLNVGNVLRVILEYLPEPAAGECFPQTAVVEIRDGTGALIEMRTITITEGQC